MNSFYTFWSPRINEIHMDGWTDRWTDGQPPINDASLVGRGIKIFQKQNFSQRTKEHANLIFSIATCPPIWPVIHADWPQRSYRIGNLFFLFNKKIGVSSHIIMKPAIEATQETVLFLSSSLRHYHLLLIMNRSWLWQCKIQHETWSPDCKFQVYPCFSERGDQETYIYSSEKVIYGTFKARVGCWMVGL